MDDVVTRAEQVTPVWLTSVLRNKGLLESGRVTRIKIELTRKLRRTTVSRLKVDYSPDVCVEVPSRLFLKVAPSKPSEVEFYNVIAGEMADPFIIRCYHAAYSPESGSYHLLLDDLSETHFQPESPRMPSRASREAGVKALARLHAYWWDDPRLGKQIGKLFNERELDEFVSDVERSVTGFIDFLGYRISRKRRSAYDQMLSSKHKVWGRLTCAKGLTVTHGDVHWWNFLYPLDPKQYSVAVYDWELWHVDLGPRDLAFLVALGGYSERDSQAEQDLIRLYYEALVTHGVRNYTWNDFWEDYRWSAVRNLNIPVIQWSHGQNKELWSSNLERALAGYEDLRCAELLG